MNTSNTAVGDPMGAFVIIHAHPGGAEGVTQVPDPIRIKVGLAASELFATAVKIVPKFCD